MEKRSTSSGGTNELEDKSRISSSTHNSSNMMRNNASGRMNNLAEMKSNKSFIPESSEKKFKAEEDKNYRNDVDSDSDRLIPSLKVRSEEVKDSKSSSVPVEASERKLNNGRAIKLINIDNNGKFALTQEGKEFLESIEDNIALVSVAGAYRTGKSFLLGKMVGNNG